MPPRPTASATTFIAPRISAALLIGGRESSTERSRRDGAVETEPQTRRIAGEGEFDRLAAQRRCFAIEQQLGRPSRPVDRAARPTAGISGPPLRKRSTSTPFYCCCCFLQRNISHRSTSIGHLDARRRMPSGDGYHVIVAILLLLYEAPRHEPAQQHDIANRFSNRSDGRPVSGVQPNSFRRRCRAA